MATKRNTSGSRPGRASRALALALALAAAGPGAGAAQGVESAIVVVDMQRVLAEAAAARALRDLEIEERRALRAALDRLKQELEAEEAELVVLRDTLPAEQFDQRARAFDQKVRTERRAAQEKAAAIQERFSTAARALEDAAQPALDLLMREQGAVIAFDRAAVLRVVEARDLTDALIARLDAAQPAASAAALLPATAP